MNICLQSVPRLYAWDFCSIWNQEPMNLSFLSGRDFCLSFFEEEIYSLSWTFRDFFFLLF